MKNILIIGALICAIGAGPSPAPLSIDLRVVWPPKNSSIETPDGRWWRGLASREKPSVISAMIATSEYEYAAAIREFLDDVTPTQPDAVNKVQIKGPTFSKALITYVRSIDTYYSKHPSKYGVPTILGCLADKPYPQNLCQWLKVR